MRENILNLVTFEAALLLFCGAVAANYGGKDLAQPEILENPKKG